MAKVSIYNLQKKAVGELELSDAVFGVEVNEALIYDVLKAQLASKRGGNAKTKVRPEVSGSTRKLYRQKGTGAARHGAIRASQYVGGGKAHGPRVRDFDPGLNKKIRRLGLGIALSVKASEGKLMVVEDFALGEAKTKTLLARLAGLGVTNGLFVDGGAVDQHFGRACANLEKIDIMPAVGANVYDILNHDMLVLTRAAVAALEARVNG